MRPMLRYIQDDHKFDLNIIVTDQHLDPKFGMTVNEVKGDFPSVTEMPMPIQDGSPSLRVLALKNFAGQLSQYFTHVRRPDILLLYGDRGEVLEAASVATLHNVKIGHMQGGDLSGSVDEHVRHAITKLSHLHFVSCASSRDRVIGLGENPSSVFLVGDNHIDEICEKKYTDKSQVRRKFGLQADESPIILLQHSETTTFSDATNQIGATLSALKNFDNPIIAVYPCSDPGFNIIIEALDRESRIRRQFTVYKNIDAVDFWGLMNISGAMIGNSSAGIIEARYFNLPVVNIGKRQNNRATSCNVLNVSYSSEEISLALSQALKPEFRDHIERTDDFIYGNGDAGKKIVEILRQTENQIRLNPYLKNFFD